VKRLLKWLIGIPVSAVLAVVGFYVAVITLDLMVLAIFWGTFIIGGLFILFLVAARIARQLGITPSRVDSGLERVRRRTKRKT
jgi:hypothetical protein